MVRIELEPETAERKARMLRRAAAVLALLREYNGPGPIAESVIEALQRDLKWLANLLEAAGEPDPEPALVVLLDESLREELGR